MRSVRGQNVFVDYIDGVIKLAGKIGAIEELKNFLSSKIVAMETRFSLTA